MQMCHLCNFLYDITWYQWADCIMDDNYIKIITNYKTEKNAWLQAKHIHASKQVKSLI